ncbi:MAG: hypothetical protein AAF941_01030 [Pseudomonadota bacterium]
MKKTLIALATATFAVIATPAVAATVTGPTTNQSVTNSIVIANPAQMSVQTSELRGKRRGAIRHRGVAKFKHKGFRSGRFNGHSRGFKVKKKVHLKHNRHFLNDGKFHHRNVKGKYLKQKHIKRYKY